MGAFITFNSGQDITKVKDVFGGGQKVGDLVTDFTLQRPVDPCNVKWKNMHIKGPERCVRGFLVALTLLLMIYFSFLIQVNFNNLKFESDKFEKIDCTAYHEELGNTKQNM